MILKLKIEATVKDTTINGILVGQDCAIDVINYTRNTNFASIQQMMKSECEIGLMLCYLLRSKFETEIEWTKEAQIKLLKETKLRKWFGYLYSVGILPLFSMEEANFSGVDLSGIDLRGATLADSNLQGANLENAKLQDADFRWAIFDGAALMGANLHDANLGDAHLSDTKMRKADLKMARLDCATLIRADLENVNLEGASLFRANLRDTNLCYANLQGATLRNANLVGANLERANLVRANLRGAKLDGANLNGIIHSNDTIWPDGFDVEAAIKGSRKHGTTISNENRTEFWCFDLGGVDFSGLNLSDTDLRASLGEASLRNTNLRGANLEEAVLSFSDSEKANFEGANLKGADLRLANLRGANFTRANLSGADLGNASLGHAILDDVIYDDETIWPFGFDMKRLTTKKVNDAEEAARKDYNIDDILIRTNSRKVHEVAERLKTGWYYIVAPESHQGDLSTQSRLVESILIRIPLPPIYLAEDSSGKLEVVIGASHLCSIKDYLNGKFALRNSTGLTPGLEGKCFNDLSPKLQNRIECAVLGLYSIDSKTPDKVKKDIIAIVKSNHL